MKKITIFSILILSFFLNSGCVKNTIITTPAYSIGVITSYYNSNNFGGTNNIGYDYTINGEQYGNYYTDAAWGAGWAVPNSNFKKGDMYMVQYDAGCENRDQCKFSKDSRILLNYRVHDSTDYNNYVTQFAVTLPTP